MKREEKIKLIMKGENTYEVTNDVGGVLLKADQDYSIYFKNVNFKQGFIEGRYLGEATEKILDDQCKDVKYKDGQFWVDGEVIKTARLVAVNNKLKTLVVIESN
jgi:hypothetical protein